MDSEDQSQRGTQLLEIYALEIQMHNEMRNVKKLKVQSFLSPRSLIHNSNVEHRKFTMHPMVYVPQFHIRGSWVLSRSAEGRCGWVKVSLVIPWFQVMPDVTV